MEEILCQKKEIDNALCDLLESYIKKYMKKLYDTCSTYKVLQIHLAKVSEWNDTKKHHEYQKFIKWSMRKKNISADEFETMCFTYFSLCIRILLQNNVPEESSTVAHATSNLVHVFYNCMKSVCKHLYYDPTSIHNPDITVCISKSLQQNLNIPSILRLVSLDVPDYTKYDFTKSEGSEATIDRDSHAPGCEEVQPRNELRYVSSDEFQNNYRHLKTKESPSKETHPKQDDIKHISFKG
jgi:hypothetical protein